MAGTADKESQISGETTGVGEPEKSTDAELLTAINKAFAGNCIPLQDDFANLIDYCGAAALRVGLKSLDSDQWRADEKLWQGRGLGPGPNSQLCVQVSGAVSLPPSEGVLAVTPDNKVIALNATGLGIKKVESSGLDTAAGLRVITRDGVASGKEGLFVSFDETSALTVAENALTINCHAGEKTSLGLVNGALTLVVVEGKGLEVPVSSKGLTLKTGAGLTIDDTNLTIDLSC